MIILLILLGGWLGIYVYDKGFTKKWRGYIKKEFEKRDMFITLGKLTLDPVEGLVARDLKFYAEKTLRTEIAEINRVVLDVDVSRMIQEDLFLNKIVIRDADLKLPLDPNRKNGGSLEFKNLNARIYLPDGKIDIDQATGIIGAVRVNLTAQLLRPQEYDENGERIKKKKKKPFKIEESDEQREALIGYIKAIQNIQTDGVLPTLDVEISGDLEELEQLRVNMHLEGQNLSLGDYRCTTVSAIAELRNRIISVRKLQIEDEQGRLKAQCDWLMEDRRIDLDLSSGIAIDALVQEMVDVPMLRELVFYKAPKFTLSGRLNLPPPREEKERGDDTVTVDAEEVGEEKPYLSRIHKELLGRFDCDTFSSRGQVFDSFGFDFSVDGDSYFFRDMQVSHQSGSASGSALYTPEEQFKYNADVRMDPTVVKGFMGLPATRSFLSRWEFGDQSSISIRAGGSGPDQRPKLWHTQGVVNLTNFEFNGNEIESLMGRFDISRSTFQFRDFQVYFPAKVQPPQARGLVRGDYISYDMKKRIGFYRNLRGQVYPVDVMRCFSPGIAEYLGRYRFKSPPRLVLNGTIDSAAPDWERPRETDAVLQFETDDLMYYDFLGKTLPLKQSKGALKLGIWKPKGNGNPEDRMLVARGMRMSLEASLFGGDVSGYFETPDARFMEYDASVKLDEVGFKSLANLYSENKQTQGDLTGHFDFTGEKADISSIRGTGVLYLLNGNMFSIPLLGPLSNVVSGVVPLKNVGYSVAREASAAFMMQDGSIYTENLESTSNALKMKGSGSIDVVQKTLDFDVRVNARGPTGLIFGPLSYLMEVKGEGELSDPRWGLKLFTPPKKSNVPVTRSAQPVAVPAKTENRSRTRVKVPPGR